MSTYRTPRPDDAPDTRAHILAVGRRMTAQRGYTGVGLSELLRSAGVPKGSFYHYFPSKEAYGCAVLEDFVAGYAERLKTSLDRDDLDGRTRFMAYFADWLRHQTSTDPQDHCLVVRLSAEVADLSDDMSAILSRAVRTIIARLTRTLQAGMADGSLPPLADPGALAQALYHQWLGASLMASLTHDPAPLQAAMAATEAMVPRA